MSLSQKDMHYLCSLAKIKPQEDVLGKYALQCANIIDYMHELEEVDTHNVEALYSPVMHKASYREDTVKHKRTREEILANTPFLQEEDGEREYFIVPKIVESK